MADIVLTIPQDIAELADVDEQDIRIEIATRLYESRRLSLNAARRLSDLDISDFFRELGKREIDLDYTLADLDMDAKSIEEYNRQQSK